MPFSRRWCASLCTFERNSWHLSEAWKLPAYCQPQTTGTCVNWHVPSQQSDVLRLMADIADSFGRKDAGYVNDAQDGEQQVWKSKVVACLLPGLGAHPMASSSFPVAHQLSPTWLGMTSQSMRAFAGLSTRAAAARPPAQAPSHRPYMLEKSGRGSKQAQKSRKHVKNHATPNKRKNNKTLQLLVISR